MYIYHVRCPTDRIIDEITSGYPYYTVYVIMDDIFNDSYYTTPQNMLSLRLPLRKVSSIKTYNVKMDLIYYTQREVSSYRAIL